MYTIEISIPDNNIPLVAVESQLADYLFDLQSLSAYEMVLGGDVAVLMSGMTDKERRICAEILEERGAIASFAIARNLSSRVLCMESPDGHYEIRTFKAVIWHGFKRDKEAAIIAKALEIEDFTPDASFSYEVIMIDGDDHERIFSILTEAMYGAYTDAMISALDEYRDRTGEWVDKILIELN